MFKGKIALVHDWLISFGGAEQVLLAIHELFPESPVFTSIFAPDQLPPLFSNWDIRPSFLQHFPRSHSKYQLYLPLMPLAFESFDLREFDLVISSSHACAKGIITGPQTRHIAYIHTPMRYAWDMYHAYINAANTPRWKQWLYQPLLHYLRLWDQASASRPDLLIANSQFVQGRIKKYWRRDSQVLYPPVNLPEFSASVAKREDFFLLAGRLVPYKRGDLAIEAFNQNGLKLVVAGDGPERKSLEKRARGNIQFLGRVSDAQLQHLYTKAQGLIYPGIEDFGIMPVEAMAQGCPVLAYGQGGATETVIPGKTGLWFSQPTPEALNEALSAFTQQEWDAQVLYNHALRFSKATFQAELQALLAVNISGGL